MIDPATYIKVGDEISVAYRSQTLSGFSGRVLEIGPGEYGRREIVIQKNGTDLLQDGAVGVSESAAVLTVRRGDSWVGLPLPLLIEEATIKAERSQRNEAMRIQKRAPLFAEQIEVRKIAPEKIVERFFRDGAEMLGLEHARAIEANELRAEVEKLTSAGDFATLCQRRENYPRDGTYGVQFWRKHLLHIRAHGTPAIYALPAEVVQRLNLPWLKYGERITWATAPGGPRPVEVKWVGPTEVLCRLLGEPNKDYDPRLFPPSGNVWLKPEDFSEYAAEAADCPAA